MNTKTSEFLDVSPDVDAHARPIPAGTFCGGDELPPGTFHKSPNIIQKTDNWVDDRVEINPPLNDSARQAKGEPRPLIPPGRPA